MPEEKNLEASLTVRTILESDVNHIAEEFRDELDAFCPVYDLDPNDIPSKELVARVIKSLLRRQVIVKGPN
jgi:hypothetical protein